MLTNYYYNTLSPDEKEVYTLINNSLWNRETECRIVHSNWSREDISNIWNAVVFDHPDMIHYPGLFRDPILANGNILLRFLYCNVDRDYFNNLLNRMVCEIEQHLPTNASDYLVCKTIYDKIASTVNHYEYQALNDYLRLEASNPSRNSVMSFMTDHSIAFSPYGIITKSKGECHGLSKLYMLLCEKFGVQCTCVEAKTNDKNEYPHMLNVVEIAGKRAFVDVSYGLKIRMENLPLIRYDYFLVTTQMLLNAYRVDIDFDCHDETLNYYAKNKVWFRWFRNMREYLCSYTTSFTQGEVRCYYEGDELTEQELDKAFSEILEAHCSEGCKLKSYYVKNGFCIGFITKDAEE